MNRIIQFSTLTLLFLAIFSISFAKDGEKQKKVQKFTVTKTMPFSAEQVWAVVGEDYGYIAHSHPRIVKSEYINGTLKAEEGAERVCYFNDSGSKFLSEKIYNYDPGNMTFVNVVFQAGKFPVDPDLTRATYKVEAVDAQTSKFTFDMQYRTKPAMMGGMMKNKFSKLIKDYAIAIEHHIKTGEQVTKENL